MLLGTLVGISDRALREHLALYTAAVVRLNAIEAAYPLLDWTHPTDGGGGPPRRIDDKVVDAPVAKLDLEIQNPLAQCIARVEAEARANLFNPPWKVYLGDDEFWAADRGRLVNVPWYLANPTLWRLAMRQERTAYTVEEVMRSLRHELGHVVNYAYELWKTPEWRATFGDFWQPYEDVFSSDPRDESQVEYLTNVSRHYAQKHPDEAWAEAFARWLDPAGDWREEYRARPKALAKLEGVDLIMAAVVRSKPTSEYLGRPVTYRSLPGTVRDRLGGPPGAPQFSPKGWSEHTALLRSEPAAFDAVVLHELFFGQFIRTPGEEVHPSVSAQATKHWGSWESYLLDLRAICGSTSGWALTVWDPYHRRMRNVLVEQHHVGHLAGCPVLLAIDCHEHAYFGDYATRKDAYLGAFFINVNWGAVEARLRAAAPGLEP